jgi:2-keto-4-pentenoate hydratase
MTARSHAMPPLTFAEIDEWAARLAQAAADREPIAPLTDVVSELAIEDAYAIAQRIVERRVQDGARVVGHKIGLTSLAVQRQLGVNEPDFGALLDVMQLPDGGAVDRARFIAPRVELELAFHLGDRLAGPGVTVADVRRATAAIQPAFELVDSRIADWRIRLADTVADSASSSAFVLGGERAALRDVDTTRLAVGLRRGDEVVETGVSSAVLGDPCAAVAWLANALTRLGTTLQPGDVVLSGACTRMVDAHAGDAFIGDFGPLGEIALAFT